MANVPGTISWTASGAWQASGDWVLRRTLQDQPVTTLSGVIANQNTPPQHSSDYFNIGGDWYFQEFYLPDDIRRGVSTEARVPDLTGFQVCVGVESGTESVASLSWEVDTYFIGHGWTTLDRGTTIGAQASGDMLWFDVYLNNPIPIADFYKNLFRLGVQARSRTGVIHQEVEYDGELAVVNGEAYRVSLVNDVPYNFLTYDGVPSILLFDTNTQKTFYSVQQGINKFWYTVPNPFSKFADFYRFDGDPIKEPPVDHVTELVSAEPPIKDGATAGVITSDSFTVPDDSLVVVLTCGIDGNPTAQTCTVSDNGGHSWVQATFVQGTNSDPNSNGGAAGVFYSHFADAATIQVSATYGQPGNNNAILAIQIFKNAVTAPGGSTATQSGTDGGVDVTTTIPGSVILGCAFESFDAATWSSNPVTYTYYSHTSTALGNTTAVFGTRTSTKDPGQIHIGGIWSEDITSYVAALEIVPSSLLTPDKQSKVSLLYRILGATADSGIDFLGNPYRQVVHRQTSDNVAVNTGANYWLSKPNPSKDGVETLYFDVSKPNQLPQVVDKVYIDPLTPNILCNIYWSTDGEPGSNQAEWDDRVWNPIETLYLRKADTYALPNPVTANYIKLEFTDLQAKTYEPYNQYRPIIYAKFPQWVLTLEEAANPLPQVAQATHDPFTNSDTAVDVNLLDLMYRTNLESEGGRKRPNRPILNRKEQKFHQQTRSNQQIDINTVQQIKREIDSFQLWPAQRSKANNLLNSLLTVFRQLNNSIIQLPIYPIENPPAKAVADTTQTSSVQRDDVLADQTPKQPSFLISCRHSYQLVSATLPTKKAYFAGIKEVAFTREHYSVAYDSDLYIELAGDDINLSRNDFDTVDMTWVTYDESGANEHLISREQQADTVDRGTLIPPHFFGQHLLADSALNPEIPVDSMRLWDSDTSWCSIDSGTITNQYDFTQLDLLFDQASRVGADVEFAFGNTPQWAITGSYPQPGVITQCLGDTQSPPKDETYWTNFVTALTTHCIGKVRAYEVWNEWDQMFSGTAAQMAQMTLDASNIIRSTDPNALVLSPSISSSYSLLTELLSLLPAGTVDAIAVHTYTDQGGTTLWPESFVPGHMQSIKNALPEAFVNTPIWSTQGGWGQDAHFSMTASDQRAFIARFNLLMFANGFVRNYWYAYPSSQWGTLFDGTSLTPAGIATATVYSWLAGARLISCQTDDNNLWIADLTLSNGKQAQIVWITTVEVPYSTQGFSVLTTLDGLPANAPPSIQVTSEPVLLTQ